MNLARASCFVLRRWRGEVPLRTLLWRDLLGIGTAINLLATFTAFMAASQGAATWVAAAIHFAPLPVNVFLFAAVQRTQPRSGLASALALVWLAVMIVV